jgi:hypothetical protein
MLGAPHPAEPCGLETAAGRAFQDHSLTGVLKNKHQAVSQGVRRFEKRSIFIYMRAFAKAALRKDHGLTRGF